jgi:internalin A
MRLTSPWMIVLAVLACVLVQGCRRGPADQDRTATGKTAPVKQQGSSQNAEAKQAAPAGVSSPNQGEGITRPPSGPSELDWVRALTGSDEAAKQSVPAEFAKIINGLLAAQAGLEFDQQGRLIGVDLAGERRSGSDAEIALVVQLPHLRRFRVAGFGVTPAGVQQLAQKTTLEELGLENTQIDDQSLAALKNLPRLWSLNLRRSVKLTDGAIGILADFPALTHLYLLETQFSSDALERLSQLPRLRLLDLRNCAGVNAQVLTRLAELPQLADLRLRGYHIDDTCLSAVGRFPRLISFTLEESPATPNGFQALARLPLESLTLFRCTSLTDDALAAVVAGWTKLRTLSLRDLPLRGTFLSQLRTHPSLRVLYLPQTMVDDSALTSLRELPSLEELSLAQTLITDAGLEHIAAISTLRKLNVSQTQVTDVGVQYLSNLSHLESLDLSGNLGITDAAVPFLEKLPQLREVFLDGTSVTVEGLKRLGEKARVKQAVGLE